MKVEKTKEKGSQHDLENVVDKEETPIGRFLQNAKPQFMTIADV